MNSEQDTMTSFLFWSEIISPTLIPQHFNVNLLGDTKGVGERDLILKELQACATFYHSLLGDWKEWKEVTKIKNPDL